VPWLPDLGLPQEDSVSFKAGIYNRPKPAGDHADIALIDLPHISNFTDLEPLLAEPDIWLRTVRHADDLGEPDCIILPGSKNVIADLAWLRQSGLAAAIALAAEQGREIVGICGGFQMLGRSVTDPHGLEGQPGSEVQGLGLLPVQTELAADKTLTRREGTHLLSGMPVRGYEIHHGRSDTDATEPLLAFADGASCGQASSSGTIWGSYLHGIFDSDPFRRWFINRLRERKGLPALAGQGTKYDLEPAFDRLAETIRRELDMQAIYGLLKL
jgi:adenosylcobyric acid synthase